MDGAGFVPPCLPRLDLLLVQLVGARASGQSQAAREQIGSLVLFAVELQGERVTGIDDEELARVVVGVSPPDLMSQGFSTRCGSLSTTARTLPAPRPTAMAVAAHLRGLSSSKRAGNRAIDSITSRRS